jgi:DNA-binding GntR family transcriptional regulator
LADRGDLVGFVVADHRFHAELLALSGNRYLVDVVSNLRTRSRLYGLQALAERGELVSSAREHGQLVDLLLEGHGDEAAALMRTHIGHVRGAWA